MDEVGGKPAVREKLMAMLRGKGSGRAELFTEKLTLDTLPVACVRWDGSVGLLQVGKIEHSMEGCACPMGMVARAFLNYLVTADLEKKQPTGRPYILAHPELKDLPAIGPGGPNSTPDAEKLVAVKPDVIFASYLVDRVKADDLQAKTNIPVVVLSYGQLATFDEELYQSLMLIGKVIGQESRAREVVDFIKRCQADLHERTKDVPEEKKPTVYVGALGMKGTHGIESTQGQYPPFIAVNARNVVDETGKKGSVMIDREKLLSWNPEIIFIDEGGYSMVRDDYRKNQQFYRSLTAVKKGNLYGQIPYNYYTTNIDTALADAYYAGKVIYPECFADVDPAKKADDIYTFLLGTPVYARMAQDFGGFKRLTLD
ncbi:MAG: ABC transporter substrate-binding protein [Thermoanaerobacterales bacterium]|nr:ABC transporter substrate-binding protein [Thermoanaerobacterales bacterium]